MRKNIPVWVALASVIIIAAAFFFSLVSGGSQSRDSFYIDLMSFPAYVKNGYESAYARLDPQLTDWDMVLYEDHNSAILMKDLPAAPFSYTPSEFLSVGERKIESFTILIPFEVTRGQIDSLYDDNPVAPGMYLAGIGEVWEIYLNGELIAKQIHLDENGRITSFRSQRGVSIPFDKRFLNEGDNQLVFHIVGSRSSDYTGLFYSGPYYIGNFTQISSVGIKYLTVALCTFFIFLGLYHVLLFFLRKAEQYNLYFGVFASLLAAYYFARSSVIYHIFEDTAITKRIEYAALYLLLFTLALFLENLNFGKIKRITVAYGIFCGVLIVLQFVFTIWFAQDLLTIWMFAGGAYIVYILGYDILYTFAKSVMAKRKEEGDRAPPTLMKSFLYGMKETELGNMLLPILIVFATAIFDLMDMALFNSGAMLSLYSFALFMIFMSITLARKYTTRFEETSQMNEMLEMTVKQRTRELEDQVLLAEAASNAKSSFLSNMSHEIRTPLNAIIGMTSIGKLTPAIEKKDEALSKIGGASKQLLGIINDILDISKIEADKFELSFVSFDYEKTLQKVADIISLRMDEKQQKYSVNIDEKIPRLLIGDDQRLSQVMINLLSNANKFTPVGGSISLDSELLSEEDGMCRIQISVIDTGIGIDEEHKARLFKSFEQADASTSRQFGGTGLGLSISKRIIELMDGDIWVESEPGKGSKFIFTVLLKSDVDKIRSIDEENSAKREPVRDEETGSSDNFSGQTIILAEDVEINREIVLALLEHLELNIDCAENGAEALRLFTESPDKYDMIFMDIMMPGMDGYEATRRIRALDIPKAKTIPIIAMTANVFREDVDKCMDAGMNDHLGKPLDFDMVLEKLRTYLK